MASGFSGLFPGVMECRKREYEKLKEQAKVAFTEPQEMRIREIVAEELSKRPTSRETINDLVKRLESLDKVSLAEPTTHGSNEAAQDKE